MNKTIFRLGVIVLLVIGVWFDRLWAVAQSTGAATFNPYPAFWTGILTDLVFVGWLAILIWSFTQYREGLGWTAVLAAVGLFVTFSPVPPLNQVRFPAALPGSYFHLAGMFFLLTGLSGLLRRAGRERTVAD